eukprot:TRINITY_DN8359_c0_g2_i1.p1 TRINITY_DN8359_c0_g2~~TRINITY_DN8359_c0_g2_i1.p1  ORF type:complete len:957 (+),score=218.03 TRINITY_DN8359_c0_g2_i1:36-2873(+)
MALTVYFPVGVKLTYDPPPLCQVSVALQQLCRSKGLDYSKLLPRTTEGVEIAPTILCSELTEVTLLSKDNFETTLVDEFTSAAWNQKLEAVKTMLTLPCYVKIVNRANSRGQAALYCAARQRAVAVVIELLKCPSIDVNVQVTEHGGSPLHAASFASCGEIVALLLSQGADLNLKNKAGITPSQEANGPEVIRVYKIVNSEGVAALSKEYPSVQQLITELGGQRALNVLYTTVDVGSRTITKYKSARALAFEQNDMMWTWNEHFAERLEVTDLSPMEVAQQITLIDHKLFFAVRAYELNEFEKADPIKTPNIFANTEFFNLLGAWIATEILKNDKLESRIVVLSFVVEVLQSLIKYNNINSSFAIELGLRASALDRLKATFLGISDYLRQYIQTVKQICVTDNNFQFLRNYLKRQLTPGIPYLGLFTKDAVFAYVGNKEIETRDRVLSKVIQDVEWWQKQPPHPFKAIPRIQHMILNAWTMTTEEQYTMSLLLEPRKKTGQLTQQEIEEEEAKREKELEEIKTRLTDVKEKEKTHYRECSQKLNIMSMIAIIKSSQLDSYLPSKEGNVPIHSIILKARCPTLNEILKKECFSNEGVVESLSLQLMMRSSKKTIQALATYLLDDIAPLDDLSPSELFALWDISELIDLHHLVARVHTYARVAQNPANAVSFALAQIDSKKERSVWRKTLKLLNQRPALVEQAPNKSGLLAAMAKWQSLGGKDEPIQPHPSTWQKDFSSILTRKGFTDLQLNVTDIAGKETTIKVHNFIIKDQTNILSLCKPSTNSDSSNLLPTREIMVPVPVNVFLEIITFAYTRHFGSIDSVHQLFIWASAEDFGLFNHANICALLLSLLRAIKKKPKAKLLTAIKEIRNLDACTKLHAQLSSKLGNGHALTLLVAERRDHLFLEVEKIKHLVHEANLDLLQKIDEVEAKIKKLKEENASLKAKV